METVQSENIELYDRNEAEAETKPDITDSLLLQNEKPKNSRWCTEKVFWKCRRWMVITSVIFFLIILIIITLILCSTVYTEEDDYKSIINGSSQYYTGTIRISDQCLNSGILSSENKNNTALSEELMERISDVFRTSPALGHYFNSAEVVSLSDDNDVATYQLQFTVPREDSHFLKYTMSEEFVGGVLRQDVYDQEPTGCTPVLLDPSSVTLSFLRRDE